MATKKKLAAEEGMAEATVTDETEGLTDEAINERFAAIEARLDALDTAHRKAPAGAREEEILNRLDKLEGKAEADEQAKRQRRPDREAVAVEAADRARSEGHTLKARVEEVLAGFDARLKRLEHPTSKRIDQLGPIPQNP